MLQVRITDSDGNEARLVERGLLVSNHAVPAPGTTTFDQIPFISAISVGGTGEAADTDLRVNGSVNPIDAFISALDEGDLYIKTANIFIEGSGNINLSDFGDIAGGLPNGISTFIQNQGVKFPITRQPILTNSDMVRIGTLTAGLGSDESAFRLKQQQGSGDTGYNPVWDMTRLAAGTEGVRLSAGTKQRLGITINDDLRSLVSFNIIFSGYIRLI